MSDFEGMGDVERIEQMCASRPIAVSLSLHQIDAIVELAKAASASEIGFSSDLVAGLTILMTASLEREVEIGLVRMLSEQKDEDSD